MRRFLEKITPGFILRYNDYLLKNSVLGWQLQLPVIGWLWLLITALTLPLPFLFDIDARGHDDQETTIMVCILIITLQVFLFMYILIQFNSTKSFGRRSWLHGLAEHLGYWFILLLCSSQIIAYPIILEYRKSFFMTEAQMIEDARTFNNGIRYFMGAPGQYRYFLSDESYLTFMKLYGQTNPESSVDLGEEYYIEKVKPALVPYFVEGTEVLDSKYDRSMRGPKLYLTNYGLYVYEEDERAYDYTYGKEKFIRNQIGPEKNHTERIQAISDFIEVYNRYYLNRSDQVVFESPEMIERRYMSNAFPGDDVWTYNSIDAYAINSFHSTIRNAKYHRWDDIRDALAIAAHVCLFLATFIFIFKNVRLRDFVLLFVYTGLFTLAVVILCVISGLEEDLALHVVILIFFLGVYFAFIDRPRYYSPLKSKLIMLSNLAFSYAPIFIGFYLYEYLEIGHLDYDICNTDQDYCDRHNALLDIIRNILFWGGPVFYLLVGSILYKRAYERMLALPLSK